jgi:hypothetical protein
MYDKIFDDHVRCLSSVFSVFLPVDLRRHASTTESLLSPPYDVVLDLLPA